jgi:hypothetical protein
MLSEILIVANEFLKMHLLKSLVRTSLITLINELIKFKERDVNCFRREGAAGHKIPPPA